MGLQNFISPLQTISQSNLPVLFLILNINYYLFLKQTRYQNIKVDGEHELQLPDQTSTGQSGSKNKITVFCEGMHRSNPKEFITLKSDPRENYSEIFGKRLRNGRSCPNNGRRQQECPDCIEYRASGVTFFKKVRIDIKRMTLIRKLYVYFLLGYNKVFVRIPSKYHNHSSIGTV